MNPAQQQQLRPFRQGTRKRRVLVTTVTYTGANLRPPAILLPSTGYLSRLLLVAHGAIDESAGGTIGVDGLAGLYNQVVVSANLGTSNIVQASGAGLDVAARWSGPFGPIASTLDVSGGAGKAFNYSLPVPIAMNRKRQFALGLINLQDPQIQVLLQLVFNAPSAIVSTGTAGGTTSIAVDVYMEFFDVPQLTRFAQPPRAVTRILEDQFPQSTQVGLNLYQVPRLGMMSNFSAIAYANSARMTNAAMQEFDLRLNKTDVIEARLGTAQPVLDSTDYGASPGVVPGVAPTPGLNNNLQPGVFTWNGWGATDVPDNGDFRDCLDTLEVTTTEFLLTVATGTTVVGTDIIRAVRRTLQMLS